MIHHLRHPDSKLCQLWVKTSKAQVEHKISASPQITDIRADIVERRFGPLSDSCTAARARVERADSRRAA